MINRWCFCFVDACVFFKLICIFFPEYVQYGLCLLALSRFKSGIGKKRSNNVTEFPRSSSPLDRPKVLESDSSIVQQLESHTVFYAAWIWCSWTLYYLLSIWRTTLWKTNLSTWIIHYNISRTIEMSNLCYAFVYKMSKVQCNINSVWQMNSQSSL